MAKAHQNRCGVPSLLPFAAQRESFVQEHDFVQVTGWVAVADPPAPVAVSVTV